MKVNLFEAIFLVANSNRTDGPRDDNDAVDYDATTFAREKQIKLFFEATLDEDPATFEVEERTVTGYVHNYYRFCENDALQVFMPPSV